MLNEMEFSEESFHEYVLMPWDDKSELFVGSDGTAMRWKFIQDKLSQSENIRTPDDLVNVIKSYNVAYDSGGKQVQSPWKFSALREYFDVVDETERNEFFKDDGTLKTITNLALRCSELVPKVKLLKSGLKSCLTLHQLQIASLLANAFLCTYCERDTGYPSINFNKLFEGPDRGNSRPYIEKIKCIIHYFRRINEKQPTGNVSFYRLCINDNKLPRWDKTTASLCSLKVESQGRIEDQEGFLQMDFANKFVGGGVLGRGCVQEEIRFIICPELIIARLFTQCLADNEALFVIGAERYCKYTGFSDSFRFDGDYRDTTPFDDTKHRKTYLIVLDALYFSHSSEQYRESKILRELKKAYVGFKPMAKSVALPLATGNWGCGAFRGDPQLKSVLQLMASSQARRDILYLTFGDSSLKKQIDDLYKLLKECEINVGTLYRVIRLYNRNKSKNQTLFDFIQDTIINFKKRNTGKASAMGVVRKEPDTPFDFTPPDTDADCGVVEKRIRKCSVSDLSRSAVEKPEDIIKPLKKENNSMWVTVTDPKAQAEFNMERTFRNKMDECETERHRTPSPAISDIPDAPSPSLLSRIEEGCVQSRKSENETCGTDSTVDERTMKHTYGEQRHKIYASPTGDAKTKTKKFIQPKITDCFFKK